MKVLPLLPIENSVLVNEKYVNMLGYETSVELIGKDPLDMVDYSEISGCCSKS